jgi:energy-coupling factor transport system substrate-specific component
MTSDRVRAVRLRPRSAIALALVSTVGVIAFGWPLLADPGSDLAHSGDAPLIFALLLPLLLGVLLAEIADGGLDAKAVALLGVLAAAGAALRPLGGGITGFSPVFLLIILGGRVLGRGFGFLLGAVTLFASALLTGGVGPWLPFQMLGCAWVGFGAGCLPPARGRREVWLVATYGALSGIAYGFLLNLWFWPFTGGLASGLDFVPGAPLPENLARFLAFCLATSLGFDLVRAVGTFILILVVGGPLMRTLRRASRRAAFEAPVEFVPPVDVPTPVVG